MSNMRTNSNLCRSSLFQLPCIYLCPIVKSSQDKINQNRSLDQQETNTHDGTSLDKDNSQVSAKKRHLSEADEREENLVGTYRCPVFMNKVRES